MVMVRETTKVISAASISLYPSSECLEEGCGWTHLPSPNARTQAKRHTKETGHGTRTEQINRAVYQRVPK